MTTRYDTSAVPLQGAYVAKRCPVRAQNDAILPGVPVQPDAFVQRLFDRGNAFEDEVLSELDADWAAVLIEGRGLAAETATLEAMRGGARLILNGRLADEAGRRVGKPDLLVQAPTGYRAIDIKFHRTLDVADPSRESDPALVSDLSSLSFEAAREDLDFNARRNEEDLLQLAHYQRMLEAMGMGAEDGRVAGIIGTDRLVVWYDLDAAVWKTPAVSEKTKLRSSMERYDFEFDFRLDIIAVARQHQLDSAIDLLVVPVRCAECPDCPWSEHCGPILEAPPGDVSLLPRLGWTQWKVHRDHGVNNRAQLAALDVRTAELVGQGVDVARLLEATEDLPPTIELGSFDEGFVGARELRTLDEAGFVTVGDLARLCRRTASYSGSGLKSLPAQIDLSRAALGPEAVYSRRGIDVVSVPRADVEVDVDMENVEDGCYLWGCLVTDRSGADLGLSGYRAFVTWEPMTPDVETENSLAFWRWLMELRTVTHAAGRTFRAYCYSASAENTYLRRVGLAAGIVEEVGSFIASDEWVDMLNVWDSQLITGGPSGLKVIAPLTGLQWAVDDPGGGESMVKHDIAIGDGPDAASARDWLLQYNLGDVQATLSIREWMDRVEVPRVEELEAQSWDVR